MSDGRHAHATRCNIPASVAEVATGQQSRAGAQDADLQGLDPGSLALLGVSHVNLGKFIFMCLIVTTCKMSKAFIELFYGVIEKILLKGLAQPDTSVQYRLS